MSLVFGAIAISKDPALHRVSFLFIIHLKCALKIKLGTSYHGERCNTYISILIQFILLNTSHT